MRINDLSTCAFNRNGEVRLNWFVVCYALETALVYSPLRAAGSSLST